MRARPSFVVKVPPAATSLTLALLTLTAGCARTPTGESVKPTPSPPAAGPAVDVSQLGLSMADGSTKKLSEMRGKVVVLDFWATYCKPCVEKLPHLQKLAEEWGDKVIVIAVTLDPDVKAAAAWAKAHKLTLPVAAFDDAMKPLLFPGEESIVIPQVRVVGPDGKLARSFGPESSLDELKASVDALLAPK